MGNGVALGSQTQASMIDIIGMSFIPTYKVIYPFLCFMPPVVDGVGSILNCNTVCFIVTIIRDIEDEEFGNLQPCQLAVSSFSWIE